MVLLVSAVSFLAKNLTDFFIVVSFIGGYMLISSTDAIVAPSIFNSNSSILYLKSDAWTIETHE